MRALTISIIALLATACAQTTFPDAPVACPTTVDDDSAGSTDEASQGIDDTGNGVTDPTTVIVEPELPQDYEQPDEYTNGADNWVRVLCTESCSVSYIREGSDPWELFASDSKRYMKDGWYTFSGEIIFPALEGRHLLISVGGTEGVNNGTYVEVSKGNTFQYQALLKAGGFVYKTSPRFDLAGTGPKGYYEFTVIKDWNKENPAE